MESGNQIDLYNLILIVVVVVCSYGLALILTVGRAQSCFPTRTHCCLGDLLELLHSPPLRRCLLHRLPVTSRRPWLRLWCSSTRVQVTQAPLMVTRMIYCH